MATTARRQTSSESLAAGVCAEVAAAAVAFAAGARAVQAVQLIIIATTVFAAATAYTRSAFVMSLVPHTATSSFVVKIGAMVRVASAAVMASVVAELCAIRDPRAYCASIRKHFISRCTFGISFQIFDIN